MRCVRDETAIVCCGASVSLYFGGVILNMEKGNAFMRSLFGGPIRA